MTIKKKAVGVVCEYNPFHNGHKHHIDQSLKESGADVLICAMSGNFTQRGEMALLDKWKRAEMAVLGGANLVVEIPAVFAVSNSGSYARAGIEILESLRSDYISFGIEDVSIDSLKEYRAFLDKTENRIEEEIRKYKKAGLSYPKAKELAALNILINSESLENINMPNDKSKIACEINTGNDIGLNEDLNYRTKNDLEFELINSLSIYNHPNNILALEYLKNIKSAEPLAINRLGFYDDLEPYTERIASASSIREMIKSRTDIGYYIPFEAYGCLMEYCDFVANEHGSSNRSELGYSMSFLGSNRRLFNMIVQECSKKTKDELNSVFGAEEGLGSLLYENFRRWKRYDDIVKTLKSKAYTQTRIQRVLINLLLGIDKNKFDEAKNYIRLLAFDEKGADYLKYIKNEELSNLPIITNINKEISKYENIKKTLDVDILASDIYNQALGINLYQNSDFVKFPLKVYK